jgi:hypothetical protein
MAIPSELVRAVREHRIVPFIGAGVSVGVKRGLFPTWTQLMERLAGVLEAEALPDDAQRVRRHVTAEDYLQAAEVAYQKLGAYRFNRAMRETFRLRRPGDGDLAVVEAIWALRPPLVISTNYDDVLRWTGPADVQVVANDQAEELALLHEATSEWPWIWHLHGTIQRLGTLILAGTDYRRLYGDGDRHAGQYDGAVFKLHQTLADRPLLYIGFSLSDPYVLQQIADVLRITKGKSAPSYALMKRGAGDAAALWSNYNIQLVEYEDHGRPLADLLQTLARQALGPPPAARFSFEMLPPPPDAGAGPDDDVMAPAARAPAAPLFRGAAPAAAAPAAPPPAAPLRPTAVPRPALEGELLHALRASGRLLVLAPRRGGSRSLSRALAAAHFGDRTTWLSPPNVPSCTAEEYFGALTGEPAVDGFLRLETWLHERARALGGEHLIVLAHDGGPLEHLKTLGNSLKKLLDEQRRGAQPFFVLVAGGAPCAWLRFNTSDFSLFSGAPVRHVPPLDEGEVRAVIDRMGLDGARHAADVHRAAGGHPGMVEEALLGRDALDPDSLTERLAQSPAVRGVLRMRLSEDDREGRPARRHARWALGELVAGRAVRKLSEVEDELQFAEVRLYYDGLVMAGSDGATVFRCEAARRAAKRALELEEGL